MKVYQNKNVGIVSYNIHYRYSNYGSLLQTYALQEVIKLYSNYNPVVIDYCPVAYEKCNPLNPLEVRDNIQEKYKESNIDLNSIIENEIKIKEFIKTRYNLSKHSYFLDNFNESLKKEELVGFICGSDAIWSIDYFGGFDPVYFGEYPCMKNRTITYASSFGETKFDEHLRKKMLLYMKNFNAIGVRESTEIESIRKYSNKYIERVLDPTLLLSIDVYKRLMVNQLINQPYLLIYSRREDKEMINLAKKIADKKGLRIINISLNVYKDRNFQHQYSAGVEEFLSLIYFADFVVTNSLHGTIFSVIMNKEFLSFPRINGNKKIDEFLKLVGLECRKVLKSSSVIDWDSIKYEKINSIIDEHRNASITYLKNALDLL